MRDARLLRAPVGPDPILQVYRRAAGKLDPAPLRLPAQSGKNRP
jgi:hypothetical protein